MSESKENVSFVCQRCFQPIVLDDFFNTVSKNTFPDLKFDEKPADKRAFTTENVPFGAPEFKLEDYVTGIDEFLLLNDKDKPDYLSPQLKLQVQLFDILSEKSNVDHPLCEECADSLYELLQEQLQFAKNELRAYSDYFDSLTRNKKSIDSDIDSLANQLAAVESEERQLLAELVKLTEEEQQIDNEIRQQEDHNLKLVAEEQRYWKEYTKHRYEVMILDEESKNLEFKTECVQKQLKKLEKTNVFNATFHIWHRGHFATINNFRLGRTSNEPVDWSEINAACGQTVLLLHSIARKIDFTFQRYKIVPYGNHSFIEVISDKKKLPLYFLGGIRYLWNTRFDSAMVAFLDCLQQFQEYVERHGFRLPYQIDKEKIFDGKSSYSIKVLLNSEDQWTKALKFMLTNLRWSLAWVSSEMATEDKSILAPSSSASLTSPKLDNS